jgi:O-antigen ligase
MMMARWGIWCAPLAIALGSIPMFENMNLVMRPLFGVTILAALLAIRGGFRAGERLWLMLLIIYMTSFLLSAANSVVPDAAAVNVGRQFFMMLLSFSLVVLFRDEETRKQGFKALLLVVISCGVLTAWVYATLGEQYGFTYEGARLIKNVALTDYAIGLNTLSYLAVIAMLGSWLAYRPGFWGTLLLFGCGTLIIFLLGSRSALVALAVSWLVFASLRRIGRIAPILAVVAVPLVIALAVAIWFFIAGYAVEIREVFGEEFLREISVGRTDMWVAGFRMWLERPIVGWGPDAWKVELLQFLGGTNEQILNLLTSLTGGSFHNGFVTVVAERGTLGLAAALAMQVYLFWCAFRVYLKRHLFSDYDARAAAIMPMLAFFMFMRSLAESSGLFGAANSEVDYLTHFVTAYIVALNAYSLDLEAQPFEDVDGDEAAIDASSPATS